MFLASVHVAGDNTEFSLAVRDISSTKSISKLTWFRIAPISDNPLLILFFRRLARA
jgi:hypothetical protein